MHSRNMRSGLLLEIRQTTGLQELTGSRPAWETDSRLAARRTSRREPTEPRQLKEEPAYKA
jgi:hypothetical protein